MLINLFYVLHTFVQVCEIFAWNLCKLFFNVFKFPYICIYNKLAASLSHKINNFLLPKWQN